MIVGTDFRILLISSFLAGAGFLVFCDTIARTIITPNELPIGVITGIIGGLVFIVILSRIGQKSKSI
jgi:iron complex transport system permease protein